MVWKIFSGVPRAECVSQIPVGTYRVSIRGDVTRARGYDVNLL